MPEHALQDELDLLIATTESHPCRAVFVACLDAVKHCLNMQEVCHLCIKICDAAESREINHKLRGKDASTNVIAIDYQVDAPTPVRFLGDVLLCAPVIQKEADQQTTLSTEDYWCYITLHGILHLCGFDHQTDEQEATMKAHEQMCLTRCQTID